LSWDQTFFDPIELPNGRKAITLRDAALYITRLPKDEQDAAEWQTAEEILIMIGERGGDPLMALIAMLRALNRNKPRAAPPPRQKRGKVYKVIR
jgi:hypothetical protein